PALNVAERCTDCTGRILDEGDAISPYNRIEQGDLCARICCNSLRICGNRAIAKCSDGLTDINASETGTHDAIVKNGSTTRPEDGTHIISVQTRILNERV